MLTPIEKEYEKYNPQLLVNIHHYIEFPNEDRKETIRDLSLHEKCIVGSVRRVLDMGTDYMIYAPLDKNKCASCTRLSVDLMQYVLFPIHPKRKKYEDLLTEFKNHIKEDHKIKF